MSRSIYVTIGNSDDRLTQAEYAEFHHRVDLLIRGAVEDRGGTIYGAWVSPSTEPFQNACWCFGPPQDWGAPDETALRVGLRVLALHYRQHSIAWAEAEPEFLTGVVEQDATPA